MNQGKKQGWEKRTEKWPWLAHRRPLMHISLDRMTMKQAVEAVKMMAKEGDGAYVVTPNVDHLIQVKEDREFADIYHHADLILADGAPLLWFAKGLKDPIPEKVSGSDLFPRVCEMAAENALSVFFLGGREGAAEKAANNLKKQYPKLKIAGICCPAKGFETREKEIDNVIDRIREAGPDILFTGLGTPKQEKFYDRIKDRVSVPVTLHVGASFDFAAGIVKRAPAWMSRVGLEWLYRLCREPARLFKRYLIDDLRIFPMYFKCLTEQKKKGRHPINPEKPAPGGKKILVDLTSLDDHLTGLERYAISLTRELLMLDTHNQYILFFKGQVHEAFITLLDDRKRAVVLKRHTHKGGKLILNQILLPLALYKQKADITIFPAFPCPLLYRRKGIYTLVADLTCWDVPGTMKNKAKWFFRVMIRHSISVSERIITISKYSAGRIRKRFKVKKNQLILAYCGVDQRFIRPNYTKDHLEKIRAKYHLPKRYLLSLSTMEPRKNLPLLIRAYVQAREKFKGQETEHTKIECLASFPLVLAGRQGWLNQELSEMIRKEQILYTGFVDDEDLPAVYQMAECFLFPSMYEGFGLPPLEALAAGTKVISSDAASLPEVLKDQATYFASGDLRELSELLLKDDLKEHSGEDIAMHLQEFNWEKSAQILLKTIEQTKR